MLNFLRWFLTILGFTFVFCAHKAPPLYIDRIDPKLKKITAINERQVLLQFSEGIDSLKIDMKNFLIYSETETLGIISANSGNTSDQIFLYTSKMKRIKYNLSGQVHDCSGRIGYFKAEFNGSTKPDTVAPFITRYSKGFKLKNFYLEFSEPVDTDSIKYSVFPKRQMTTDWRNMKKLFLNPESDSLNYDTTYYLYIKEIKDLSGNCGPSFVTTITPDTVYDPVFIRGTAIINDTALIRGIALLGYDKILGVSIIENGNFLMEVRDSMKYFVQIFGDSCYGADSVSAAGENIIRLSPGVIDLDSIID